MYAKWRRSSESWQAQLMFCISCSQMMRCDGTLQIRYIMFPARLSSLLTLLLASINSTPRWQIAKVSGAPCLSTSSSFAWSAEEEAFSFCIDFFVDSVPRSSFTTVEPRYCRDLDKIYIVCWFDSLFGGIHLPEPRIWCCLWVAFAPDDAIGWCADWQAGPAAARRERVFAVAHWSWKPPQLSVLLQ